MNNSAFHGSPGQNPLLMYAENIQLRFDNVVTPPIFVVEWSASQRAVHVQTLVGHVESNILAFLSGKARDYVVMHISPSRESCDRVCSDLQTKRDRQDALANFSPSSVDDFLDTLSP